MRSVLLCLLFSFACEEQVPGSTPAAPSEPTSQGPTVHQLTPDSDPGAVDDTLIAHIKLGNYDAAYQLMASPYREAVPQQTFRSAVSRNPYLKTTTLIGCHDITTYEGSVHVRECILRSEAGSASATLHYSREAEGWRMTGMLIGGTPAFPGPR